MSLPCIDMDISGDPNVRLGFDVDVVYGKGGKYPDYEGSYELVPKLEDQVLPTKEKSMMQDLVVKEVPVARVSNPSGGKTCTICAL